MNRVEFILYVEDQKRSARFYAAVLGAEPSLDVPGMTEFPLPGGALLGLMPRASIERLLPQLSRAPGNHRAGAELYLFVDDVDEWFRRAIGAGATRLSEPAERDWQHRAGYVLDPDGYVVSFAREI
jgi:uncharacterized glyoxalase superfamily protein PhnB